MATGPTADDQLTSSALEPRAGGVAEGVILGTDTVVEEPAIVGKPGRGGSSSTTHIGARCVIRAFTTIYAGVTVGDGVQFGHGAMVREDNVIGDRASIGTNAVLEPGNRIGARTRVHTGCFLEMVTLEEDVFVGPNVVFTDDPHPPCPRYEECVGGAHVKAGARIGANSTILPGVVIGRRALVGAGSVVVQDVPDGVVVAGVPAREMGLVSDLTCRTGLFDRPYEWEAQ